MSYCKYLHGGGIWTKRQRTTCFPFHNSMCPWMSWRMHHKFFRSIIHLLVTDDNFLEFRLASFTDEPFHLFHSWLSDANQLQAVGLYSAYRHSRPERHRHISHEMTISCVSLETFCTVTDKSEWSESDIQKQPPINEPQPLPSPSSLPKTVMNGGQCWLTWWSISHPPQPAPRSPLSHLLPLPLSSPCTAGSKWFACLALAFNV